jgi:hypothetical protein
MLKRYSENKPFLEQSYFLGCNAVHSDRSPPTFRRSVLSLLSGSKRKASKKAERSRLYCPPDSYWFLIWLSIQSWRRRRQVSPKRRCISTRLYGDMKSYVSWDITSCSQVEFNMVFRGSYRLFLQGWKANQVRFHHEADRKQRNIYSFETSVDFHRTLCYISRG